MFWQMTRIEEYKLLRRRMVWIQLTIVSLLIVAILLAMYAAYQSQAGQAAQVQGEGISADSLTWPSALVSSLGLGAGNGLGGMLAIILAGAFMAQEYTWRTLSLWLSRGQSRVSFLAAKFTALLGPMTLLVLVIVTLAGGITAAFSYQILGHVPLEQVKWGELVLSLARTLYTSLPYAALGFFLAVASRSTIVAISGGLSYLFLLEGIAAQLLAMLGGFWARIIVYLPTGLTNSLMQANTSMVGVSVDEAGPVIEYLSPGPAAVLVAVYTAVLFGLALVIFRRQDLS